MKKTCLILAAVAVCSLLATNAMAQKSSKKQKRAGAVTEVPVAEQINILENGNVDGLTEWMPAGVANKEENNYTKENICTYDPTVTHTSDWSGSLKIGGLDCTNNFKPWQAWRHRDIMVEPGATYAISVWVKTVDIPKNANLFLSFGFKDDSNQWLTGWVPGHPEKNGFDQRTSKWIDTTKGTHDWIELTGEVTAPENAAKISYFQGMLNGIESAPTAYAWFDDFKIVKIK